jgi:hypothetical protein
VVQCVVRKISPRRAQSSRNGEGGKSRSLALLGMTWGMTRVDGGVFEVAVALGKGRGVCSRGTESSASAVERRRERGSGRRWRPGIPSIQAASPWLLLVLLVTSSHV